MQKQTTRSKKTLLQSIILAALLAILPISVLALYVSTNIGGKAYYEPTATTITLQQGVTNYSGSIDAPIRANKQSTNFGGNARILINGNTIHSTIRFDLSEIPRNAEVFSAKLELSMPDTPQITSDSHIFAFELLQPWTENKVTWKRARVVDGSSKLWGLAGAQKTAVDRLATPSASITIANQQKQVLDITATVKNWVANPTQNNGLLLTGNTNNTTTYAFASSEHSTRHLRPKLIIQLSPTTSPTPAPTPDPSNTPLPSSSPTPATPPATTWNSIDSWTYQLSGYANGRLDQIKNSAFDLAVIDLARDGYTDYFTKPEIQAVQQSGKIVLAYFEIGAIEEYRPEWDDTPEHIKFCEVDGWPDERYAKFWHEDWWPIVRSRIDRALQSGFDGAYLDMVVTYEEVYYNCRSLIGSKTDTELAADMIRLIDRISRYAKHESPYRNSDFKIVPQNAPELYTWDFPTNEPNNTYINAIDGLGMEELFIKATDSPCTQSWCADNRINTQAIRAQNKLILTVDYANQNSNIETAYREARARTFVPYASVRNLDVMRINTCNTMTCDPR